MTFLILTHSNAGPQIRRFRSARRSVHYFIDQDKANPSAWCSSSIGWIRLAPWRLLDWRGSKIAVPA